MPYLHMASPQHMTNPETGQRLYYQVAPAWKLNSHLAPSKDLTHRQDESIHWNGVCVRTDYQGNIHIVNGHCFIYFPGIYDARECSVPALIKRNPFSP